MVNFFVKWWCSLGVASFLSPELAQFENTQIAEIHYMVMTF